MISGDESRASEIGSDSFSLWLQDKLIEKLQTHKDWAATGPIALGSWSRGELSPRSDIDLLFVGDETAVKNVTTDFAKQGLKLRYRMPEDNDDWTAGVEPFDIVALLGAKALSADPNVIKRLANQKEQIRRRWNNTRTLILRAMKLERASRSQRFDSITSYLEPNLKYGSGGLRDLEQALVLRELFPEKFQGEEDQHAFNVLSYYKRFFLLVRQKLHLSEGAGDLLTAPDQSQISTWLGFKTSRDFMKEIQKGVSRVSFYADWAFEQATASKSRRLSIDAFKLGSPNDLFRALKLDPSVLMQNRVRNRADQIFKVARADRSVAKQAALNKLIGRELSSFIDPSNDEAPLNALFRARLIDHCVPEFRRIVGHVQHDQYHRFSVDAHILQALRELGRLYKKPKLAGALHNQLKNLTKAEWRILSYACLYHDIAKGRDGDHSVEGIAIAEKDLKNFEKSTSLIEEVTWIVEEHLILSTAAFKQNPASPKTWAHLALKGVEGRRIPLLAAFTIVDIRATNPDAWTPWKERLLNEVVSHLENPESSNAIEFAKRMEGWVERLDSFLISMLSPRVLSEDLVRVIAKTKIKRELAPLVQRNRNGQTWVRFHAREDRPGLFAHYVGALGAAGLSIRHASIHTFEATGVYDWFEVKSDRSPKAITKLLELALDRKSLSPKKQIRFDIVSLVSEGSDEWVLSFRGKDQSGALLSAASQLLSEGAEISWARVHTWGRQIDDVFGIKPLEGRSAAELVARLS